VQDYSMPPTRMFTWAARVRAGQWFCLEWRISAAGGQSNLWLDETERDRRAAGIQCHPARLRCVFFGTGYYQSDGNAFDLWLDDIAIDGAPIGCVR
jgi:hypothetical protein